MKNDKKVTIDSIDYLLIRDEIWTKERIEKLIGHIEDDLKTWKDRLKLL